MIFDLFCLAVAHTYSLVATVPVPPYCEGCHAVVRFQTALVTKVSTDSITLLTSWQPPKRFSVTPTLVTGPVGKTDGNYLLREVRPGDRVDAGIRCTHPGAEEICIGLRIERRPGGRVPHSSLETYLPRCTSAQMNARQAHEERGVPLPAWIVDPVPPITYTITPRGEIVFDALPAAPPLDTPK